MMMLIRGKEMKEALYYEKKNGRVQCYLCPFECVVDEGKLGNCGVRKNQDGKLYSMVYGKPVSVAVDPIEKKPLYHFLPGTRIFSIGTAGCNLHCQWCQNWEISQAKAGELPEQELQPEAAVEAAIGAGCPSIAFTYNEPMIFYEYALDIAKISRKKGLKTVIVSNGFVNKEPLEEFCKYLDAANIDLKSFDDKFYRKYTGAWLEPVLESLKILKKKKVHLEITNLIIPGLNDDMKKIEEMCRWIKEELGEVPLHFSAFFPNYKMQDIAPTSRKVLEDAKKIGEKYLKDVHLGNVF